MEATPPLRFVKFVKFVKFATFLPRKKVKSNLETMKGVQVVEHRPDISLNRTLIYVQLKNLGNMKALVTKLFIITEHSEVFAYPTFQVLNPGEQASFTVSLPLPQVKEKRKDWYSIEIVWEPTNLPTSFYV